jgi:hypothetical protein
MKKNSSRPVEGKRVKIPKGTEQETGLTRGKTEKKLPEKSNGGNAKSGKRRKAESKIIPAGTQQETGLTIGQTDKPFFIKRNK